ncbi:hypothetical protein RRG08_002335 [Elysia crispata]|uniref:Uncharacterized protein n=1 Tax=Elysia crispata TaxID=231223 RepID=A0AAE0ZAY4_9GAST|nr:hypothetical protein RRG08_002335 [Elysia crispata]
MHRCVEAEYACVSKSEEENAEHVSMFIAIFPNAKQAELGAFANSLHETALT